VKAALITAGVVALLFAWASVGIRYEKGVPRLPQVNSATARGQDPWAEREAGEEKTRQAARKAAFESLDRAWSTFCTEDGRKKLTSGLSYYFWLKFQQHHYANWGEAGERHAAEAWDSAEDNRVTRLIRETYSRGYFTPADVEGYARAEIADLVRQERVTGKPCAG
jgi:hypothetical protein